jgi:hypothetical protein
MNKYVQAFVIGGVIGVCGAILIRMFVFPDGPTFIFYGLGIGGFFAYILSNLAGNKKVAAAGAAERQLAMGMRPPLGKALLIPYREGFVAKLAGLNLALDGQEFVQLTSPKFACVVISPGRHTLAGSFGGFAGAQSKAALYEFEAPQGGVVVVRIDARMGLVQGKVVFTPESDLEAVKKKIDGFQMAAASPATL